MALLPDRRAMPRSSDKRPLANVGESLVQTGEDLRQMGTMRDLI